MKRPFIIIIYILIVIFTILIFCKSNLETKKIKNETNKITFTTLDENYLLIEKSESNRIQLPFIFPKDNKHREIYKNFLFGVTILDLYVDGNLLKPQVCLSAFDDIESASIIKIDDENYIYIENTNTRNIDKDNWTLLFNSGDSKSVSLMEYRIPKKASSILIEYNINFPENAHSSRQVLKIIIEK